MMPERSQCDGRAPEPILPWLQAKLFSEKNGRGIATGMIDMIERGILPIGTRLPTVRDFARRIGTTSAAVAEAWARLRALGLVDTRRRGGTTVIANGIPVAAASGVLDLSQASADPRLQPSLELALAAGLRATNLHAPDKAFITPTLQRAVEKSWPFVPQAWTTGAGGAESALAAYGAAMAGGTIFAVETPTSPRILEALAALGVHLRPVACDREGPLPSALETALLNGATTFVYQPRAQLPLGHDVSAARSTALAKTLAAHPAVTVIEDDSLGPLTARPGQSVGGALPDRILHIRAYCRAYGADLKVGVIGGGRELIEQVNRFRGHGYNVTSRILQDALAYLIETPSVDRLLGTARVRYDARRLALSEALRGYGVETANTTGLILWVPVHDEGIAILNLARRGISVGAGGRCFVDPSGQSAHIRVATSRLPDDRQRVDALAATIARAIQDRGQTDYD